MKKKKSTGPIILINTIRRIKPGGTRTRGGNENMTMYNRPSPQGKLAYVGNKTGNPGLKDGQGTTYPIYDHLPLAEGLNPAGTLLEFFKNSGSRKFPLTNLMEGKLPVGEGFVLARIWFNILTILDSTGEVTNIQTFAEFGVPGLYKMDFAFINANQIVLKGVPATKQKPQFNMFARHTTNEVIHLDTDLTIMPLIEFVCAVQLPAITIPTSATLSYHMGCYCEGPGALLNMRTNS